MQDYQITIMTDEHGQPRITGHQGLLPPEATFTITGSEEDDIDPWTRLVVFNDVVIDTGAVTGVRIGTQPHRRASAELEDCQDASVLTVTERGSVS
jgi:hypothetical protein